MTYIQPTHRALHVDAFSLRKKSRRAFTIMEVMVAIAVIALGLMALLDGVATQSTARSGVKDSQRISALVVALQERLNSQEWKTLGLDGPNDSAGTGWSTPKVFDQAQPFAGGKNENELLLHGIIVQPTGLQNLRVYLEYYRAQSVFGGAQGLFDTGAFDVLNRLIEFASASAAHAALPSRLKTAQRFDTAPTSRVDATEAIAIRIIVVWAPTNGTQVFGGKDINTGTAQAARMYELIMARGGN